MKINKSYKETNFIFVKLYNKLIKILQDFITTDSLKPFASGGRSHQVAPVS